jgi:glycerate kinase
VTILIAPDKFKGSLTAAQTCDAIAGALKEMYPEVRIIKCPLADGGEGTFEILKEHFNGRTKKIRVLDPLLRPVESEYGISADGTVAFVEMARASGLHLLSPEERNPLHTSSMGTGQLIAEALREDVKEIVIGIGGSATNDAAVGMASALGYRFLDKDGKEIIPVGRALNTIANIDVKKVDAQIKKTRFTVLCDVTNPLYGLQGAAHVYGPQKGADAAAVEQLDNGLKHLAGLIQHDFQVDINFPGAGAAGGFGGGAIFFLGARLKRGIDYISEITGLEEKIKAADHVLTGEGKVDEQTFSGKVVSKVLELAVMDEKPVTIICGQNHLPAPKLAQHGIRKIIALARSADEVKEAMADPVGRMKEKIMEEFEL